MKTKEELNALKEEFESVTRKLAELTGEELAQVSGGLASGDGRRIHRPTDDWPSGDFIYVTICNK